MTTKLQVQPYPVVSNDNLWCITVDALIILIIIWALGEPRNSTLKHFSLHVYHAPLLLITASYNIYFCIYRKRAMDRSSNNFKIVPLTNFSLILQANNIKLQRRLKKFSLETSRPFWQISPPSTLWRFQCFHSIKDFLERLLFFFIVNRIQVTIWSIKLWIPVPWSSPKRSLQFHRRPIPWLRPIW